MKRWVHWIGTVVTMIGALGLVMFGDDLIGVVIVFNAEAGEKLADITDVRVAIMSAMALFIGLILSSVAPAKQTTSPVGKRVLITSGILLFCGALPLAWGMLNAIQTLEYAMAWTYPARYLAAFDYPKFIMSVGYLLLLLSAILALMESTLRQRYRTSLAELNPSILNSKYSLVSMILCGGLLIVLVFTCLQSQVLDGILRTLDIGSPTFSGIPRHLNIAVTDKTADFAIQIGGILNKSFIVFVGLAIIGILQILKAASTPAATCKSDPSD